ncbi:nitrogen regulatory protein P-II family [Pelagirhabdus alkalitolerans]|uniref:Nitrogen regulatory protein P-II family n=1 Tax=Pelagirhabdus alkalitolerans TaxID=1612202 RepID=A0A1G6JK72_9BACI|nr:P-II family nitrogen regulator [Pelagirhabdus alkalitolerans]SDC19114.1 nitrogen regulatory protein P-II family [Pelagirhabdus alkalitolerans]
MKKIEAIIRPEKFQTVRDRLMDEGISGITVTEVAGTGKQKGQTGVFRGTSFEIKVVPKIKIELVINEEALDKIIDLIIETCSTDQIGDGKIFVYPVEDAIRIRTKERGQEAVI